MQLLAWLPCAFPILVEVAKKMPSSDVQLGTYLVGLGMIVLPWRSPKPSCLMCLKVWDARLGLKLLDWITILDDCICMFVASYNHNRNA